MENSYLTAQEVADQLRTTRQALYNQRLRGLAPGALGRRVGRRVLWRSDELAEWCARLEPETTSTTTTARR